MKKLILLILISFALPAFTQTIDAKGKKQGYWKKKDEKTNKLVYEGAFKDDKPVGTFKYYYSNDSVRAVMQFRDGGKIANAKLFHMNGKRMAEGKYINKEIKDSIWIYYDEYGVLLSKEKYIMGKKEGACYVYLPDGGLSEERNYKQDIQEGPFRQYFDGKNLRAEGVYFRGQLEGKASYYFPNGNVVAQGYYKNGNKTGPWIYRSEDGKVKDKELYKNGKLASKKETEEFFSKNKTETTKTVTEKKTEAKK